MPSLFLSYARGDDEPFAHRLHAGLTAAGFDVWFDRVSMPSRSLTFHQEIRDEVASRDRLVLIVGPKAAESLYVRQEWQFAYFEAEKIVTPILRRGDYPNVPDELKLLHCEDFRDDGQYEFHLKNLIRQLGESAPPLGKLIGVPSLPPHFLSRTDRLTVLRDALRADLDRPVVITGAVARVGVHGMGGIGKSVLAATLSRDRKIREAFPDGVVWVGLGPLPTVADLQRRVHKDLGGDGAFQTEHEGRVKLRDILMDKGVLLILDDVWRRADVDWFDVLGPRCRAMITTRDAGLLTSMGGVHYQVELLTDAESLNLLAQAAGVECDKLPSEAADLIDECGRLPLAVALCGGLIRHGFAWAKVLEQLRTSRIDRIKDPHAAKVEHENIWNAIDVSVKFLSAAEQARFLELAVFPPDEAAPIAALQTLWSHTAGFDDWDAEALVIKLSQRSLLELTTSAAGQTISLHDLVYDYAHRAAGDENALHNLLLEAYRKKCPDGWHVNPPNDGYFFTHLRHHLIAGGRASELANLVRELRWLEEKNACGLVIDLTADYRVAIDQLSGSRNPLRFVRILNRDICRILRLLDEALRRDIHFIARHSRDFPQGLFQCLWNSCWWYDTPQAAAHYNLSMRTSTDLLPWNMPAEQRLATLLEQWRQEKERAMPGFPWLRSLRPPAVQLGTAQQAVFRGHTQKVTSVALSCDGGHIVSGSDDNTVRVWDAASGQEIFCLRGHDHKVKSVALSADASRIVSGSCDNTVRVWDAISGQELFCLRGHEATVNCVAMRGDGGRIVSGSDDKTVRVWDPINGHEVFCLRGHRSGVNSVALNSDGQHIVSGSGDGTVRMWNPMNGPPRVWLRNDVNSVAVSGDGQLIVSGSRHKKVRMWNSVSDQELFSWPGHEQEVTSVALTEDGRRIVSGSDDNTVRIWDATRHVEPLNLREHRNAALSIAFCDDGRRIVSTHTGTLMVVWDTANGYQLQRRFSYALGAIALSRDGRRIATASRDNLVRVGDMTSGQQLLCLRGHEGMVQGVMWSCDDRRIVSQSEDRTIRVWDSTNGRELLCLGGHDDSASSMAISGDGRRIVSGSYDQTVRVWDAHNGQELLCLRGQGGSVSSVSMNCDGRRFVSGSSDSTVRVWDTTNGNEILRLRSPDVWLSRFVANGIDRVVMSGDGQRIVAGALDKTVRVWDATSGKCLQIYQGKPDVEALAEGPLRYPLVALTQTLETAVQATESQHPIAWIAEIVSLITIHPSGRAWAGSVSGCVSMFTLEGDPPSAN